MLYVASSPLPGVIEFHLGDPGLTKSRAFILFNLESTEPGTQEALKNVAVIREELKATLREESGLGIQTSFPHRIAEVSIFSI